MCTKIRPTATRREITSHLWVTCGHSLTFRHFASSHPLTPYGDFRMAVEVASLNFSFSFFDCTRIWTWGLKRSNWTMLQPCQPDEMEVKEKFLLHLCHHPTCSSVGSIYSSTYQAIFFLSSLLPSFISFFLWYWGLNSGSHILSHSTSPFLVKVFFEIGSRKLLAQAGFEPQSSWSLPLG
jgi:hypothetical protein